MAVFSLLFNYKKHKEITAHSAKDAVIQAIADEQGKSVNGYIKEAVEGKIKADTGKNVEL